MMVPYDMRYDFIRYAATIRYDTIRYDMRNHHKRQDTGAFHFFVWEASNAI